MKKINLIFALTMLVSTLFAQKTFTLKSEDIGGQATMKEVYNGFGCTGENVSPQLSWENAPEGTKSFAITVYDPDAPTGSGWWHWVMFDIPATMKQIPTAAGDITKNLLPNSVIQSLTDFGSYGYGGPCPPEGHGPHRYIFTIHALKVNKLGLDKTALPALVGFNLWANTIQKASFVVYYSK